MKFNEEQYSENYNGYDFHTKERDAEFETQYRPFLTISYRIQNGLEDYMTYQQISYQNGTGYINNFNGNVTNIFQTTKTKKDSHQLSFEIVHNSADSINMLNDFGLGYGWKSNYNQILIEENIDEEQYLKYINETGCVHYLHKKDNYYIDEDGLNLNVSLENNKYIMTDSKGNKQEFLKYGNLYQLVKITDNNMNSTIISYEGNKITKISNTNNNEITVQYTETSVTITSDYDTCNLTINNNNVTTITNKFGTTILEYNENHLPIKVTDMNSFSYIYEYQLNSPYRLVEVTQYGKNNKQGKKYNYEYLVDATKITYNKITTTYLFDTFGRLISKYDEKTSSDKKLSSRYGYRMGYSNDNKMCENTYPLKYVENLFANSSFEINGNYNFQFSNAQVICLNANLGRKSLQLNSDAANEITYSIKSQNDYTISFDFLSEGTKDVIFELYEKIDQLEILQSTYIFKAVSNEHKYYRLDLTGHFTNNSILLLRIKQEDKEHFSYIDNIQLEVGNVANLYNLVNNSSFANNLNFWSIQGSKFDGSEILSCYELIKEISLTDNQICHLLGDIEGSVSLSQKFDISGNKGDVYHISFWYRCEGIKESDGYFGNIANLQFLFSETSTGKGTINLSLNTNIDEWQFFSSTYIAEDDYTSFSLNFISGTEPNGIYITNVMVNKDLLQAYYGYDKHGNLITVSDGNSNSKLTYDKNNQLIGLFNPRGYNYKYEYDNTNPSRVLKAVSPTGISNEIKYDENGNPIKTIINNVNKDGKIEDQHFYHIRLKGSDEYLVYDYISKTLKLKRNQCNYTIFKVEKISDNNFAITLNGMYLCAGEEEVFFVSSLKKQCHFLFNELDNGSYYLLSKETSRCLAYENNEFYMKEIDYAVTDMLREDASQFYFEDIDTNLYIESEAKYLENSTVISELKDSLGQVTKYDIDPDLGLVNRIIKENGTITSFEYNELEQIEKVIENDKEVLYSYNDDNLISSIQSGNKLFQCTYDDFQNIQSILLNNHILITNFYDYTIGKLTKILYGNNYQISYEYNEFGQVSKYYKNGDCYQYQYNNLGNVSKMISPHGIFKYMYDYANRISRLENGEYSFEYQYNENNYFTRKTLAYDKKNYETNYSYDANDNLILLSSGGEQYHYKYDYLGRLQEKNVNDKLVNKYFYVTNGNKTSCVLSKLQIDGKVYKFIYDNVGNLVKVFENEKLVNKYQYDNCNQLQTEFDYNNNRKVSYIYNQEYNLIERKVFNIFEEFISTDYFTYESSECEDQLTRMNDKIITYDSIGNMLSIGNRSLEWKGRELSNITDENLVIDYKYNVNGIRIQKVVNNVITNYILDGSNVAIENRNGLVIYYIRDNMGDVTGLKCDGKTYYFRKNFQGDITGIYNQEYQLIATYDYDAWGNILSIKDNNHHEITDETHIAIINPFRYRGYYYDMETNLYYINSRYYSPELFRFISMDKAIYTNISAKNLYIYCGNNPVLRKDIDGEFWWKVTCALASVIINVGVKIADNVASGEENILKGTLRAGVTGAIQGAIFAVKPEWSLGVTAAASFLENTYDEVTTYTSGKKEVTPENVVSSIVGVGISTGIETGVDAFTSSVLGKAGLATNPNWFKPKKLLTCLTGNYAKKYYLETFLTTVLDTIGLKLIEPIELSDMQSTELDIYRY